MKTVCISTNYFSVVVHQKYLYQVNDANNLCSNNNSLMRVSVFEVILCVPKYLSLVCIPSIPSDSVMYYWVCCQTRTSILGVIQFMWGHWIIILFQLLHFIHTVDIKVGSQIIIVFLW